MAELCGRIKEGLLRLYLEPEGAAEKLAALVEEALPVFQTADDDLALYIAYSALVEVALMHGQMDAGLEATSGPPPMLGKLARRTEFVDARALFRFFGTTPVSELLAWLDEPNNEQGGTTTS